MLRRFATVLLAGAASLGLGLASANAQGFPARTVTFVVPFPAGGTVDQVARIIGSELQEKWGKAVVVQNRPGAGNIVGSTAVAQAAPDGHTLLLGTTSVAANPALFAKLPYKPEDLAPVVFLSASPNVLLVAPELQVRTLKDFISLAQKRDKPLRYGSVGRGSGHHICMEMFQHEANVKLTHVPYAGVAPAVAAFVAGEVPVYCSDVTGALGLIKQGRALPLALTGTSRVKAMPDTPTMPELGLKGMNVAGFIGVLTTGGSPPDVVNQLNRDIRAVVEQPKLADRFTALGYDMAPGTPEQFAAFIRENTKIYKEIVERSGIEVTQ